MSKRATLADHRREVLGLTLAELAGDAGCTQANLSKIEKGYLHKWPKHRLRFANVYRLSVADFERMVSAAQKGKGGA